jgi:hypothetical protein
MEELEVDAIERVVIESETPGIDLPTARYTLGDRDITVLGDGWPVNFDGWVEGVPTDEIQLTIALMVAGAIQASRTRNSERTNGLVPFGPDTEREDGTVVPGLDRELMAAFKKLHGRKKPPVGDAARWRDIIMDVARQLPQ